MPILNLTMDELLYLENTLRRAQGTGEPIGFEDGHDLAQSILDKLDEV